MARTIDSSMAGDGHWFSTGKDNGISPPGQIKPASVAVKFRKPSPITLPSSSQENLARNSNYDLAESKSPTWLNGPGFSGNTIPPQTPRTTATFHPDDQFPLDQLQYEKKKIGHRRVDKQTGEITYKKLPTSEIMGAIQLGISNSIGSLASKPTRDLLMQDFTVVETVYFPREGSSVTPSHPYGDFRFKTYAPTAFRYFRALFNIKPEDFLCSLTEPLRELSNPGASGSIFYISLDDQFIIKTVQRKEADFLQKLLPGYFMNLNQNPRTLLPKFFGLYCYQSLGRNVRLLIMNNLLPSSIKIHHKFDLKGSTYKRKADKYEKSKDSPTLKDLDFLEEYTDGITLEAPTFEALTKTISRDCRVLESFKIMDYSLLVGIHNIDQTLRDQETEDEQTKDPVHGSNVQLEIVPCETAASSNRIQKPDPSQRRVTRQKTMFSTWDSIQTEAAPVDLDDEYPSGGVPARNSRGDRLLLFLGIIDILQSYQLFKKFEHTLKSIFHDGDTISVHRPGFYAQRFLDFMTTQVFKKTRYPFRHSPSKKRQRAHTLDFLTEEKPIKTSIENSSVVLPAPEIPIHVPASSLPPSSVGSPSSSSCNRRGVVSSQTSLNSTELRSKLDASRRSFFEAPPASVRTTPTTSTLTIGLSPPFLVTSPPPPVGVATETITTLDSNVTTREGRKFERLFAKADKRFSESSNVSATIYDEIDTSKTVPIQPIETTRL